MQNNTQKTLALFGSSLPSYKLQEVTSLQLFFVLLCLLALSEPWGSINATHSNSSATTKYKKMKFKNARDFILFARFPLYILRAICRVEGAYGSIDKVYPVHPTRGSPTLRHCWQDTIWILQTEGIEWECVPCLQELYTARRAPSRNTLSHVNRV